MTPRYPSWLEFGVIHWRVEVRLRQVLDMNRRAVPVYASCVLLPGIFIYRHQVLGNTWEDGEKIFMEMVDEGEKAAKAKETKERAKPG